MRLSADVGRWIVQALDGDYQELQRTPVSLRVRNCQEFRYTSNMAGTVIFCGALVNLFVSTKGSRFPKITLQSTKIPCWHIEIMADFRRFGYASVIIGKWVRDNVYTPTAGLEWHYSEGDKPKVWERPCSPKYTTPAEWNVRHYEDTWRECMQSSEVFASTLNKTLDALVELVNSRVKTKGLGTRWLLAFDLMEVLLPATAIVARFSRTKFGK